MLRAGEDSAETAFAQALRCAALPGLPKFGVDGNRE